MSSEAEAWFQKTTNQLIKLLHLFSEEMSYFSFSFVLFSGKWSKKIRIKKAQQNICFN